MTKNERTDPLKTAVDFEIVQRFQKWLAKQNGRNISLLIRPKKVQEGYENTIEYRNKNKKDQIHAAHSDSWTGKQTEEEKEKEEKALAEFKPELPDKRFLDFDFVFQYQNNNYGSNIPVIINCQYLMDEEMNMYSQTYVGMSEISQQTNHSRSILGKSPEFIAELYGTLLEISVKRIDEYQQRGWSVVN